MLAELEESQPMEVAVHFKKKLANLTVILVAVVAN